MANRRGLHEVQQAAWGNILDGTAVAEAVRSQQGGARAAEQRSRLEQHFDPTFATRLALREKQIQQNYRPIIGIHKWFAPPSRFSLPQPSSCGIQQLGAAGGQLLA